MTPPTLEEVQERIAGQESVLVIEAPAGHGKTEEAVNAAQAVASSLEAGQYVLFLTHTHAARATFNGRIRRAPAVMKTIHSLAAEIVDVYATPLGLPRPLQPDRSRPSHNDVITIASQVLRDRPELARGLAARYPFILVDEYQDCTVPQAELIDIIAEAGPTRIRIFGDDLQAIYDFDCPQVEFAQTTAKHPTVPLTIPWRWKHQPAMQRFVAIGKPFWRMSRSI